MRASVLLVLGIGLAAAYAHAQNYPTPAFDCANISTPQELRICRSQELSELDGLHWHLADRVIKASADRERTRSEVEEWVSRVRDACENDACLLDRYRARNAELGRIVATLPPPAPPPTIVAPAAVRAPSVSTAKSPPIASAAPAPIPSAPQPAREENDDAGIPPWILAAALIAAAIAAVLVAKK